MKSVPITTNIVSSNTTQAMQHYVIKFVSDLRQVGGFLTGTPISSTSKSDRHDIHEILLKVALSTTNPIYKETGLIKLKDRRENHKLIQLFKVQNDLTSASFFYS
jgi:hypothetical protein